VLLRLEVRRLPPEEQTELHRLRLTALELAIPEDSVWMFLPEHLRVMIRRWREAVRPRLCTAARLRKRSRQTRGEALWAAGIFRRSHPVGRPLVSGR